MATITTEVVGHRHLRAGACQGCRKALGFDDCDHCYISTTRSDGYRTTYRPYCIDCAARLGIAPNAARCDRN
jgi:hypothetical protein